MKRSKRGKNPHTHTEALTCKTNSLRHSKHALGCLAEQLTHRASKVHEAAVSVILVLVAEIVIKLQREMDAKIGLDTNYRGLEGHLCKYLGSLNFSPSEPSLLCHWIEREEKGKRNKKIYLL